MHGAVFAAVGNAETRSRLMALYEERVRLVPVHLSAIIARDVEIGEGTIVMAGTVINPGARIGKGCNKNLIGGS